MNQQRLDNLVALAIDEMENIHHNATPSYPNFRNDYEAHLFSEWLDSTAEFEFECVNGGGAYNKLPWTKKEWRERRNHWETALNWGKVYQYGRGGRTVAPEGWMRNGNSAFPNKEIAEYADPFDLIQLIRSIRAWNKFVIAWNKDVPNMWKEYKQENYLNLKIWRYDGKAARHYSGIRWA